MRERMRIAFVVPVALVLMLSGCATTTSGLVYQGGNVLGSVGEAVAIACEQGKMPQSQCATASAAYDQAAAAFHLAETLIDEKKEGQALRQYGAVIAFVVATTATLTEIGVDIPENVQKWIDAIAGGLK